MLQPFRIARSDGLRLPAVGKEPRDAGDAVAVTFRRALQGRQHRAVLMQQTTRPGRQRQRQQGAATGSHDQAGLTFFNLGRQPAKVSAIVASGFDIWHMAILPHLAGRGHRAGL